ncbi:MAG: ubiquitin-like protein Pup [Ilumatobacteraceae bacterium]|jgi:ubiquitin-like protein Pup
MSGQLRKSTQPKVHEHTEEIESEPVVQSELSADLESVLDAIDNVLEENAEEFVRSYVQKGGQ